MRYEAAAVIRAAEIEIKEYFAIFSEDDALNIMEVRLLQNNKVISVISKHNET